MHRRTATNEDGAMTSRVLILIALVSLPACDTENMPMSPDLTSSPSMDMSASLPDLTMLVDRGPTDLTLVSQPNGLWWDSPSQALYIATKQNQVLKWTEGGNLTTVASVPFGLSPQQGNLGQLLRTSDGTIFVTVFGFGVNGGVVQIKSDGTITKVAGLDQTRRRIGLSIDTNGVLYDGWFVKTTTTQTGGVSKLALDGSGETDLITGLQKPVGVLAASGNLYVTDQKQNALLSAPLSSPSTTSTLASPMAPDLLTAGPNGDLFSGGPDVVYRYTSTGSTSNFATEMQATQGVAYDADHKRLFVAEPGEAIPDGGLTGSVLHILPVD
jgi:sugar lactone lactonase YvrE